MNSKLLLPRRNPVVSLSKPRRNPNWLRRIARWIGQQRHLIELYRFYRGLGNDRRSAWEKAGRTL